jgi:precorrin-6x reductase
MNKRILIIGGTSEARTFGTFLAERSVAFTFTLTAKPMRRYPFAYRVEKIVGISHSEERIGNISESCRGRTSSTRISKENKRNSLGNPGFIVKFESHEEEFDLIIDMAHPHAYSIGKLLDDLDDSTELNGCLWRYQRQNCLEVFETFESYEEMTKWIVKKKTKKILSFMGCKGSERIAKLLDSQHYNCQIYLRSIKKPCLQSEFVQLLPLIFTPSEMNNTDLLQSTLDEIEPDLVLLKDSGKEGGTDVKRTWFIERDIAFFGLRMPQKRKEKIFRNPEELNEFFMNWKGIQ